MLLVGWLSFLERDRLEVLRAELGELRVRGRKVLEEEVLIGRVHLDVLAPRLVLQRGEKRVGGMVVVLCVPLAAVLLLLRTWRRAMSLGSIISLPDGSSNCIGPSHSLSVHGALSSKL